MSGVATSEVAQIIEDDFSTHILVGLSAGGLFANEAAADDEITQAHSTE